jgi:hypothetical protein
MDSHQHCDHEVERASEDDFLSADREENNPNTDILNQAEAKIGWFEDDWLDDIGQIAQLEIHKEEKACDAMQASEDDFLSADREGKKPNTDILDRVEAKIGWFEDDWLDDIDQIAQLDIREEEKACDAIQASEDDFSSADSEEKKPSSDILDQVEAKIGWVDNDLVGDEIHSAHLDIFNEEKNCDAMMVTPSPRNPTTPTFTVVDNLLYSMCSLINVSYPTLDVNNMPIGSNKPIPRYRTVSLQ